MASEETAIEVTDFEFHALRKVRLTREPLTGDTSKRLAISSSLGIGIAIVATNRLLSFHTTDVHSHKTNRTNINEEVTNLRTRTTNYFDEKASLVSVSCNCDGSLVGVLADTSAGPMVHIFDAAAFSLDYQGHISPISGVRISADAGAAARCFEWSPVAADTLVAAASDRTLMTVAVKAESSSYTMMGERKLGAAVRAISWSRKGKQLVIGDDLGKVIQMKPELDIVRSTMPPDSCKLANPAVVGLCWMATTDFLVVYGSQTSKDVQSTIMITKKDKPITWTDLPDLCYGSPQSQLSPAVNALCLLEWNAILTTNTKSSDVGVVGKEGETWQVWVPDELHEAALPTNASKAETFPVGAELDLSATEQLILSENGQKRAPASPIISILTNDGLLMSYHTVSHKPASTSIQVPRKAVNLAAVRVGAKPEGAGGQTVTAAPAAPATPATPAVAAKASLFGVATTTPTAAAVATPPPPASAAQTSQLLAQLAQTPICSPNVKPLGTPAAPGGLFGAPPPTAPGIQPRVGPTADASAAAAAAQAAAAQAAAAAEAAKAEQQKKLVEDRGKVNTLLQEVQNEATALVDEMKRMKEISTATRPTIAEIESEMKVEETQKLHGLDGYVKDMEEEERRQERLLKTATIRISDRLRMVEEAGEGGGALATMKKDYDYDREESISQLQRRITNARTTMAEVQKELQMRMKSGTEQNQQGFKSDSKWTSDRVERVNATIRNIQNIVKIEREKIEDTEALVKNVMLLKLSDDEARREKQGLERDGKHDNVKMVVIKKQAQSSSDGDRKPMTNEEKAAARNRLLHANAKSLFPFPGTRRFVPEHQSPAAAALNESVMAHKSSSLNQSLASANNRTFNVNSPLRAQLEERLLEVTKPRKAIQLPSLEKFSIKQESRPATLRESPSPIVAAAAARPTAAPSPIGMVGGPKAVPAFRMPAPQASSTPKQPAVSGLSSAANLFNPATPAAAKTPEKPKTEEEESKKKDEKTAADATAATTTSIFGGAPSSSSSSISSIFGKPVAAPAADANSAAAATPAAPATEEKKEEQKDEKKDEPKPTPLFSFSPPTTTAAPAADPTPAAAAKPATSSIFGGAVTTDATKPSTSSIFGGGAATDPSKHATSSIFGAGVTTDATKQPSSIFGGGAASAATSAAVTPPKTSFFGTPAAPVSSPFGAPAVSTPQHPKSIFGGGVAAAPAPSSPFGAPTATTTTSSIFGGGVAQQQQQPSSPFGSSFGKPATTSASGFSFKSAAAAAASDNQQQPSSGFGQSSSIFGGGVSQPVSSGFGSAPAASSSFGSVFGGAANKPATSSFAAAAAAAVADEGMDDGGSASNGAFGGGGGFMGGLGSTTSANANRNVFGGGFGSTTTTNTQASSIFGKSTTSSFGAKPAFGGTTSTSAFGGGTSAFGGAASPQQSSAFGSSSPSSGFGKPAFGSGPSFGAKSIFGGGAAQPQQQQQQTTNAFGGGVSGGGFAAFANQGGGFGSVAAQQTGGSSIFGGGMGQTQAKPSIFGGGTTTTTNKFNSWR